MGEPSIPEEVTQALLGSLVQVSPSQGKVKDNVLRRGLWKVTLKAMEEEVSGAGKPVAQPQRAKEAVQLPFSRSVNLVPSIKRETGREQPCQEAMLARPFPYCPSALPLGIGFQRIRQPSARGKSGWD